MQRKRTGSQQEPERRRQSLVSIADDASRTMSELLAQPIFPIRMDKENNSLFDSHSDEEIIKICVFSKLENLELHNFLG